MDLNVESNSNEIVTNIEILESPQAVKQSSRYPGCTRKQRQHLKDYMISVTLKVKNIMIDI